MARFVNARPNLLVQDVSASVEFYTDTLGFEAVAVMGEPLFFALLVNEGAEIALVQTDEPQASGCYIYVTGVDELYDDLLSDGAEITNPLTTQPWGNRDFVIADPDGHQIALGERMSDAD